MRRIIAGHSGDVYLKPGEAIVSRNPILVSTILGSCVAITMYSPAKGLGAICHAAFPRNKESEPSLQSVDTAIRHIYQKMCEYKGLNDMVVKLFGGANVLAGTDCGDSRKTIGEQNVIQAKQTLDQLGLVIAKQDIGGIRGRKLLFSIKTGDVFLRRLKTSANICCLGE